MRKFCAKLSIISLIFFFGSQAPHSRAWGQAPAAAPATEGQITAADAEALEQGLLKDPDNQSAREQLITYYFEAIITSKTPDLEEKREKHVFWLIEHHPESQLAGSPEAEIEPMGFTGSMEGFEQAKKLWLQQVDAHPDNQRILSNAGQFFLISDEKLGRDLLEKALALDPSDTETSSRLAQFYDLERTYASSPEEKATLSQKSFSLRERALEKAEGIDRFYELGDAANSAYEAGEFEKAAQYANELLQSAPQYKDDWNYGNALFHGNIVLGRVALQHGDIVGAKEHLLAAGETPGSPQLDSFGPNLTLAKELLEKGERDVVLTYLQSCAKFWKMGGDKLQSWMAAVRGGGMPDFGANLDY